MKEKTFEESLKEIEEIVQRLEKGDVPLEQSIKLYNEGIQLLDVCNQKIDKVEKELQIVNNHEKV